MYFIYIILHINENHCQLDSHNAKKTCAPLWDTGLLHVTLSPSLGYYANCAFNSSVERSHHSALCVMSSSPNAAFSSASSPSNMMRRFIA